MEAQIKGGPGAPGTAQSKFKFQRHLTLPELDAQVREAMRAAGIEPPDDLILDGAKQINSLQAARALELLIGCCGSVQHRLGIAHDLIETVAAEGEQEGDDETTR